MDTRLEWMSRSVPIGAKRMPSSDKESPDELSMKEDCVGPVLLMAVLVATGVGMVAEADVAEEEHCVLVVLGQADDGEFKTAEAVCFDEEAEAAEWAAVIPVEGLYLDGDIPESEVATLSSVTIGRHYDGANGSGSSIRIVGTSCTGGYWNTGASWANRISSSYNGCTRLRHWDNPSKGGASEDTYGAGQTDNLSGLNNRTESVSYHSS